MASRQLDEEAIFHVAREIPNPTARSNYLDQICAGDLTLRERVEALLSVHEQEQQFLQSTPDEPAATVDHSPLTERPGSTIGRYRLMEQVGEGGMGVVFVAEQERPVRRKVALKIIKPGMDTKEVVARFEAERQALALMDHPNIAKVFDAGSTDSGRPYFVMELVRGIPITEYCDQAKLPIRDRLELFIQVCHAIQHAHQKGIIHRDVKPSNVLVTLHDGKPVPKVIDFGIAKATNQRLTERTVYTRLAQFIGTPMYMSPEQAELSGLDIDTRSDVYSLGVLLYELLTGTVPFDRARFETAAFDEIRRIVREEEPPKPSTKISTLGETATSVSVQRGTDPHGLSKSVRGDLDVIVMKAIEKDRTRRYDTAIDLAADVRRFLGDEPILARSPSAAYRFRKYARRNRTIITTSILILVLLLCGLIKRTRDAELAEQRLRLVAKAACDTAMIAVLLNDQENARLAINVARTADASPARLLVLEGLMKLNAGQSEAAIALANRALQASSPEQDADLLGAHALLAVACVWAGYDDLGGAELNKLRHFKPRTDSDHLLMAYAFMSSDPPLAIRQLENVPDVQQSPVGLLIRCLADMQLSLDRRDARQLDKALRNFDRMQSVFRNNPLSLNLRTMALASAIEFARAEGRQEDVERYEKEGWPLVNELAKTQEFVGGEWSRWLFLLAVGKPEEAAQAIRTVGRHPGTYSWFLAADCLRRQECASALREFDNAVAPEHQTSKYVRLARAPLARGLPDGTQTVRRLVDSLAHDESALIRLFALNLYCTVAPVGDVRKRALQECENASQRPDQFDVTYGGKECAQFLAERLTEQQLLDATEGHSFARAGAQFTIAMSYLGKRNRDEARKHFRECLATNAVGTFNYEWARAFLARMDADPAWPNVAPDVTK